MHHRYGNSRAICKYILPEVTFPPLFLACAARNNLPIIQQFNDYISIKYPYSNLFDPIETEIDLNRILLTAVFRFIRPVTAVISTITEVECCWNTDASVVTLSPAFTTCYAVITNTFSEISCPDFCQFYCYNPKHDTCRLFCITIFIM